MLNLKIIIGSTRPGRAATGSCHGSPGRPRARRVRRRGPRPAGLAAPDLRRDLRHARRSADPTFSVPEVRRWNDAIRAATRTCSSPPSTTTASPRRSRTPSTASSPPSPSGQAAAFLAYSGGIGGGIRAVEHLAHIAIEAELVPLRNSVVIPFVATAFGPDGTRPTTGPVPRPRSCWTIWPGGLPSCSGPGRKEPCHPRSCAGTRSKERGRDRTECGAGLARRSR